MPMPDEPKTNWFKRMLDMPNDSIQKTLFVAIALCLACSVVVASAAVFLKPLQTANKAVDTKRNLLESAGLLKQGKSIEEAFEQVEMRIVDLETGEYTDAVDPETYDFLKAAKDPLLSEAIPAKEDIAKIKRKPKYAPVYLVKEDNELKTLILPVHGYGLWSTMYAFIALEKDLNTVAGLNFYDQKETAGLGGEVANPEWLNQWKGKKLFDEQGRPRIEVIKGSVDEGKPGSEYEIDGLAGSTLTNRGVTNLMHYWLGANGFGPYLEKLRTERG